MPVREIIRIDEERCDGCALCVPACAEGAIKIIDGKAKLISETYCDGMGACLGECPQNAITIEKREADQFDEAAVEKHLARGNKSAEQEPVFPAANPMHMHGGPHQYPACPGSHSQNLRTASAPAIAAIAETNRSASLQGLSNWPVQLMLAPTRAPYFNNTELVIAADCVPFAFADFDRSILRGKALLIACPKLDNVSIYEAKLREIFAGNDIEAVTIAYMEVPCCFGLVHLIREAVEESGKQIPVSLVKLGIRGEILEKEAI